MGTPVEHELTERVKMREDRQDQTEHWQRAERWLVWSNNLYFKEKIFLSFLAFFHIFFDQFHLYFCRPQEAYPW